MNDPSKLERRIRDVFESQRLAVLATHHAGQPYASLVAFAATDDIKHLLFATARTTRKYANIVADSRVAMLVDSRSNQEADFQKAVAVTATGKAEEVEDVERDRLSERFLSKHPHLEEFVRLPTCALLKMKVDTYYMVSRFQHVMELHVTP